MNEDYLDLATVAERLEINVETLRSAIDEGKLTAIKGVWRGYRTKESWVQAWLAGQTVNPEAAIAGGAA